MLSEIRSELQRISADQVRVSLNDEFEPEAGTLVKIELGDAYWHMVPQQFLDIVQAIPDDSSSEDVRIAIEKHGPFVWHGPSPKGSRDTSP